jgi:hypothetical protein
VLVRPVDGGEQVHQGIAYQYADRHPDKAHKQELGELLE